MRRYVLAGLVIAICACGCAAPELLPTPTPNPTPTPTPAAVIALVGGEDEMAFGQMIEMIATRAACEFVVLEEDKITNWRPKGRASLILYADKDEMDTESLLAMQERGIGVYIYAAHGQTLPENLLSLCYDDTGAAAQALDAALHYENYDTPVRLIGMFTGADSDAATQWGKAVEEGHILVKGAYYEAGAKKDAAEWLNEQLRGLYEGMFDGIYCETAVLTTITMGVIQELERSDIELFSVELNAAIFEQLGQGTPLKYAVGADPATAGRLCAEQAIVLIYGGAAQALSITPSLFSASSIDP